jgi:hypothetical protein
VGLFLKEAQAVEDIALVAAQGFQFIESGSRM